MEMAQATEPALHLIEHEECVLRIAYLPEPAQKLGLGRHDATFPWIGSTRTAQTRSSMTRRTDSPSLNVAKRIPGTKGLNGRR